MSSIEYLTLDDRLIDFSTDAKKVQVSSGTTYNKLLEAVCGLRDRGIYR